MNNLCLECGAAIYGRADKKFCNDQCRTNFHNKKNHEDLRSIRKTNKILKKNRIILKCLLNDKNRIEVSKDELLKKGFDFDYHTGSRFLSGNKSLLYVYDYLYMIKSHDFIVITSGFVGGLNTSAGRQMVFNEI